jgi:hypothetical protein
MGAFVFECMEFILALNEKYLSNNSIKNNGRFVRKKMKKILLSLKKHVPF